MSSYSSSRAFRAGEVSPCGISEQRPHAKEPGCCPDCLVAQEGHGASSSGLHRGPNNSASRPSLRGTAHDPTMAESGPDFTVSEPGNELEGSKVARQACISLREELTLCRTIVGGERDRLRQCHRLVQESTAKNVRMLQAVLHADPSAKPDIFDIEEAQRILLLDQQNMLDQSERLSRAERDLQDAERQLLRSGVWVVGLPDWAF